MLAAANCAAAIPAPRADAPFKLGRAHADIWSTMIGWTAPPKAITAGPDAINAVLVGRVAEGIVVSFRGTLAPLDSTKPLDARLRDWVSDFEGDLIQSPEVPGMVHRGFFNDMLSLYGDLAHEIYTIAKAGDKLHVTGHSKGGAMALLFARMWTSRRSLPPVERIVTFAGPRCGNDVFEASVDAMGIEVSRWEAGEDLVPHLPPTSRVARFLTSRLGGVHGAYDYEPCGSLSFITDVGIINCPEIGSEYSHCVDASRELLLFRAIMTGHFDQMISDHNIGVGSPYQRALCPGVGA